MVVEQQEDYVRLIEQLTNGVTEMPTIPETLISMSNHLVGGVSRLLQALGSQAND
jgi:hypothetical protein